MRRKIISEYANNCLKSPFTAGWLFDVELFLRISNPDRKARKNFFEYPVLEWTEIPGSNIKFSDVIKGGLSMTSLILNQWNIRAKFQNRRQVHNLYLTQTLHAGETLTAQNLKSMEAIISKNKAKIILDFSEVKSLGPSVFTALIEICEKLRQGGQEPYIQLPDDADIISAAQRSSLTALFDCIVQNNAPALFKGNSRFTLADA